MRPVFFVNFCMLLLCALPAWSQTPEKVEKFESYIAAGQSNFQQGHFHEAYESFLSAEAIFSHPTLSIQIGLASARSGRCEVGKERLQELRATDLPEPLEPRLDGLENELENCASTGQLILRCSPESALVHIDGEEVNCGEVLDLPSGDQQIVVSHDGHLQQSIDARVEEGKLVEFVVELAVELEALAELPDEPTGGWMRPTSLVIGGVGIGLMTTGLIVDSRTTSRQDRIMEASLRGDSEEVEELEALAANRRIQSGLLYATGATMTVSGVVLYLIHWRRGDDNGPTVNAWVTPSNSGIIFRTSW